MDALDHLCEDATVNRCLAVVGFDLVLSGLPVADRARTWDRLHRGFRRRQKSLLFLMPNSATNVLPRPSPLKGWADDGRVLEN